MKKKIAGIVVVEGKSDTQKLQQYYDVQTFETSGLGLNDEMLDVLSKLAEKQNIIVFTDPDGPGEDIRKKVMAHIPTATHVMLHKDEAISSNNRKVGVEHASFETLERAFAHVNEQNVAQQQDFPHYEQQDMVAYRFIAHGDSKARRDFVARKFRLGTVNAKQFLKRLNAFMIERAALEAVLEAYAKTAESGGYDGRN